jgi:homoserine kinase
MDTRNYQTSNARAMVCTQLTHPDLVFESEALAVRAAGHQEGPQ